MEIQETEGSSVNTNNLPSNTNQHQQYYEDFSIFRAPTPLRMADQRSFDPLVVSIGPYNRDKQAQLAIKDKDKLQFVYDFLAYLSQKMQPVQAMKEVHVEMMRLESRAKKCYSEDFHGIPVSEFAWMMAVDGCFIIGFLHFESTKYQPSNPIFSGRWMVPSIRLDFVKVENQLPYFVLEELQKSLEQLIDRRLPSIEGLASQFLKPLSPWANELPLLLPHRKKFDHLLGLLHFILHPDEKDLTSYPRRDARLGGKSRGHSITHACKLWSRGIFLKRKDGSSTEITFQKGLLEVPCFTIDQNTQTVLRNLLTYEQGNRNVKARATGLVFFIDGLVDTHNDVAFLRHKGIISHSLGSDEEVTSLINNLNKGIIHNEYECFLCHLGINTKPSVFRIIRAGMSFSEIFVYAILHPSSFITVFVAILALYVAITQTILTVFTIK